MKRKNNRKPDEKRVFNDKQYASAFLKAVPHPNEAMKLTPRKDGGVLAAVPMRRPKHLFPPLSWILPYSSHRRVELDPVGAAVLKKCDGRRTTERIIEEFATDHKLTFREAQLSVSQFLKQLTQRGIVAIVGTKHGLPAGREDSSMPGRRDGGEK